MKAWSFLRADDIGRSRIGLSQLEKVLRLVELPCLLGVIPLISRKWLVEAVEALAATARGSVWVAQHGSDHLNRSTEQKKDELGSKESEAAHLERLLAGRRRLEELFPNRFVNVYIPPWNARHEGTERITRRAGFHTISGESGRGGHTKLDVLLDIQEKYYPSRILSLEKLVAAVAAHNGGGIMLHPEIMTDEDVAWVADVMGVCLQRGYLRSPTEFESSAAFQLHSPSLRST